MTRKTIPGLTQEFIESFAGLYQSIGTVIWLTDHFNDSNNSFNSISITRLILIWNYPKTVVQFWTNPLL